MNYLKISLGIFAALAASRFVPHPPNFTPITAVALFSIIHFKNKYLYCKWIFDKQTELISVGIKI